MKSSLLAPLSAVLLTAVLAGPVAAQAPARPTFATTKVEGTDNVYIFRYRTIRRCSSSRRRA